MHKIRRLIVPAVLLLLSGTGCYNLNTNVETPLSERTMWESFQVVVFRCHDCRDTTERCSAVCFFLEEEIHNKNAEAWENFKNYMPLQYTPCGRESVDELAILIQELTTQIHTEIVIPYIEHDANGNIAVYNEFNMHVAEKIKNKNISPLAAKLEMFTYWREKMPQKAEKFGKAIEVLENMDTQKQMFKALQQSYPRAQKILKNNLAREIKLINQEFTKDMFGTILRYSPAAVQLSDSLIRTVKVCNFLIMHLDDQKRMELEQEELVENLNTEGEEKK